MSAFGFKPCHLSYLVADTGYEDENGDYHKGEELWEGYIRCGTVPAGKSNEITFEDGTVKKYSYTVTLPADCRKFVRGDRVRIRLIGGDEREFSVLGFHRYQLQCKMWI